MSDLNYSINVLSSCPCCGSTDVSFRFKAIEDKTMHSISCFGCSLQIGYFITREAAARVWNRRPEPPRVDVGEALDWNAIKRVAYRTLKQFPMDSEERHIAAEAIASGVEALTQKADAPEAMDVLEPDLAFIDGPEQGKFYPILKFDSKEHYTAWMDAARRYRATQDVAKIAEGLKADWEKHYGSVIGDYPFFEQGFQQGFNAGIDALAAALSGKGGV